jgi:2-oxoisovalerate dehydrogenase E2 component (dihydrolipoyl transacylase)
MVDDRKLRPVKLPDLGEGLTEAMLVKYLVSAGDLVELLQAVALVETEKSIAEVTSPWSGRVKETLVKDGEYVSVGASLLLLEVSA